MTRAEARRILEAHVAGPGGETCIECGANVPCWWRRAAVEALGETPPAPIAPVQPLAQTVPIQPLARPAPGRRPDGMVGAPPGYRQVRPNAPRFGPASDARGA